MRLSIALALTSLMGMALASTAAAAPGDQVTGGGISSFPNGTNFGFTAHQGPNGVSGHATFKNKDVAPPQADRKGHVICLNVSGNRAVFAVEEFNEVTQTTGIKQFYVEDNGTGGAKAPKDELTEVNYNNCASAADNPNALPIAHGNIEVRAR